MEISALNSYEDNDIVFMTKKIENILNSVTNRCCTMNSEGLSIKVNISPIPNDNSNINPEVKVSTSPILMNNEAITIDQYAIPNDYWLCTSCGDLIKNTEFQCEKCGVFRLVESLPNLLMNSTKATKQEIALLQQRREKD